MEPSTTGQRRASLALLTDGLEHLGLEAALEWCAERGIEGVELGVGGYSPAPHVDLDTLLASAPARTELLERLDDHGLELVALNASGNPLHPRTDVAVAHDRALRGAIELA